MKEEEAGEHIEEVKPETEEVVVEDAGAGGGGAGGFACDPVV